MSLEQLLEHWFQRVLLHWPVSQACCPPFVQEQASYKLARYVPELTSEFNARNKRVIVQFH